MTEEQVTRIAALQKTFADVDPSSLEKWLDDFKRDFHVDREILIYEAMARAYVAFSAKHPLTPAARREVYSILILRSGVSDDEVLARVQPKVLTGEQVRELLRDYTAPPQPIRLAPK